MALPTETDLVTMDYAFEAKPFIETPSKYFSTANMDYAFEAQPFVRNPYPTPAATNSTLTGVSTLTGMSTIQF